MFYCIKNLDIQYSSSNLTWSAGSKAWDRDAIDAQVRPFNHSFALITTISFHVTQQFVLIFLYFIMFFKSEIYFI